MPDDPKHIHYADDDLVNPETHAEHSDVNIRALVWFAVIFVIFSIATYFLILFMYKGLTKVEASRPVQPLTQLERAADADVPRNQPLLQPFPRAATPGDSVVPPYRNTPVTDLREMRAAEKEALENYGWVDRQKGTVRIPIEDAKRLLVQRGLPVQPASPAPAAAAPETGTAAPAPQPGGRP